MNNLIIRKAMFNANLKQWQLANILGLSEYTLCRKLRVELPEEEQERIVSRIHEWEREKHE